MFSQIKLVKPVFLLVSKSVVAVFLLEALSSSFSFGFLPKSLFLFLFLFL